MGIPMKKRLSMAAQATEREARLPELPERLLDELVNGPMTAEEVEDLVSAFNRAVVERAMAAEIGISPTELVHLRQGTPDNRRE